MSFLEESVVAELKARQEIRDTVARYCRGADRCDADLMRSCFHPDAVSDHGYFKGLAHEFVAVTAKRLAERCLCTRHHMTTQSVEMRGQTAFCETYVLTISRIARDGVEYDMTFSTRYLDRFEERDGEWKIAGRQFVNDGRRLDPVAVDPSELDQAYPGARGADDPSYAFFQAAQ